MIWKSQDGPGKGVAMYYVEFSVDQNCFHIDTLDNIKANNLDLCNRGISNGYVIIAGPTDFNSAHILCQEYQFLKKCVEV